MAGTFSLSGNDLRLSDQPGCPGQGTYGWSLAHDLLTLTKVSEACAQRDVQFIGVEKWSVVHRWGASLKNGQIFLLGDGQHVARFDGQLDLAGLTKVSIEASLSIKNGLTFSPTVLTGAPGQTIAVTISNPRRHDTEDVGHTFTIDQLGIDANVPYGTSTTVTVTLPQSGSLRFYCTVHANRNQQGEFLVNG